MSTSTSGASKERRRRLATLVRIRRIEEDLALGRLAEARAADARAHALLDTLTQRYGDEVHQLQSLRVGEGNDWFSFLRGHQAITALAQGVMGAQRATVETADAVETGRDAVLHAASRRQGLERLADRAKEAHLSNLLAADQRTAEESIAGRLSTAGRRRL